MESKDNTVNHIEDCEKLKIKEESFYHSEITESQNTYVQQNDTHLIKCIQSSDVETKVAIKQETWDPNVASSDIELNPNQLSTCEGTSAIKGNDELDIEEHVIQCEIPFESQQLYLEQQNETYFVEYNESSDVDTKAAVKQETWDPNGVSDDIKCNPEQAHSSDMVPFLGTGTLTFANEIDIKEKLCFFERTSADSLNEGEASDSKNEAAEGMPLLESSRSYTNAIYSSGTIQQQQTKYTSSVSAKCNTRAQKCETKHRCKTCGNRFKLLLDLKKHNLVHKICKQICCDKCVSFSSVSEEHLTNNHRRQGMTDSCGKSYKLGDFTAYLLIDDDRKQYKCQICEKSFQSLYALKRHLLVHDAKRQFKCEICGKTFKWLENLKMHLLLHSDKRQYKCHGCDKSFKQLPALKSHLLVHNDQKLYKCKICEQRFKRLDVLKSHIKIHDDKRQYTCEICAKSFKRLENLKRHLFVHDDKRKYKCKICGKGFKQLPGLKLHLLIHDDKRLYKCQVCEKRFKQLPGLKVHLLVHDNKRKFSCEICAKSFKHLQHLKSHLLVHDDKRRYKCKVCGKSFKGLSSLKRHLLIHDDKRQHKCEICEKSFKRLYDLKTHLLVHDDKRRYKCQRCEKSFKRLCDLKTHLLVHDDQRLYKCKICEKSFKRLHVLKSHLLVHDDKRPHKCQICEKSYKRIDYLKTHLMVHDN